ncbi:MAG: hypothetical protein J6A01_02335 [Proteobacteria bacterium]|nr:hypothetical protein [Pseudomonadota bacterium]
MSLLNHVFNNEYAIELRAWGGGTLCDEEFRNFDTFVQLCAKYKQEYMDTPSSVSLFIEDTLAYGLDYGFTEIAPGYLEQIETLKELILPNSITHIEMTPKLEQIFKKNRTMIRGSFDSFAELFAHEHGLRYRPVDFEFAKSYYEYAHEASWAILKFRRNGSAYIKESVSSPGSSAGNCFGMDWTYDLPHNFYKTMTVEQIAGLTHGLYKTTLESGILADFLEKTKTHDIFWGKNE